MAKKQPIRESKWRTSMRGIRDYIICLLVVGITLFNLSNFCNNSFISILYYLTFLSFLFSINIKINMERRDAIATSIFDIFSNNIKKTYYPFSSSFHIERNKETRKGNTFPFILFVREKSLILISSILYLQITLDFALYFPFLALFFIMSGKFILNSNMFPNANCNSNYSWWANHEKKEDALLYRYCDKDNTINNTKPLLSPSKARG